MFELTEEYEPLLKETRELAEKTIKPRARELVGVDLKQSPPWEGHAPERSPEMDWLS